MNRFWTWVASTDEAEPAEQTNVNMFIQQDEGSGSLGREMNRVPKLFPERF
jgi:hypothetical protein